MATPKTVTDASSDLDEAVLNLFLRAGKAQVKVNYCVLEFVAATNVVNVDATYDSDGEIISADAVWNAGAVRIDVTLSGFTAFPVAVGGILSNASTNVEKINLLAGSAVLLKLLFLSNATPGALVDPDGDVSVNVLIIGV